MLTRAGERAQRTGAPTAAANAFSTAADLLETLGTADVEIVAAALRERAGLTAATPAET